MTERKDGVINWNKAPYGYKLDPEHRGQIILDTETAEVVRTIFAKAAQGKHFTSIAQYLNQSGIPSPGRYRELHDASLKRTEEEGTNKKWSSVTVRRIALNPVYVGRSYAVSRGVTALDDIQRFPITHEPIVTDAEFGAVMEQYRRRMALVAPRNGFLFDGLVFCSTCGSPLALKADDEPILGCSKEKSRGRGKCKAPGCITCSALEQMVVDELNKNSSQLSNTKNEPEPDQTAIDPQERSKQIHERIDLIDRIVMRIYTDMESGLLLARSGQSMIVKFQEEIASLLKEDESLTDLQSDLQEAPMEPASENPYTVDSLTQELLKSHIERIDVGPQGAPESPQECSSYHAHCGQNIRIILKHDT